MIEFLINLIAFDKIHSVRHIARYILEVSAIGGVSQYSVVGNSLN